MKKQRITIFIVIGIVVLSIPFVFLNDWILRHDAPAWMRTVIYLVNPPGKMKSAITVSKISGGIGNISYINEYFGKYAIYLSKDVSGRDYIKLNSSIRYNIDCNGDTGLSLSGDIYVLPQTILFYTTPIDIGVGKKMNCTVQLSGKKGDSGTFYVLVNKLFDV